MENAVNNDCKTRLDLANHLLRNNKFDEAFEICNDIVNKEDDHFRKDALILLGRLYSSYDWDEHSYKKAVEHYKEALEIDNKNCYALNELGKIYLNVGYALDEVEFLYDKGIDLIVDSYLYNNDFKQDVEDIFKDMNNCDELRFFICEYIGKYNNSRKKIMELDELLRQNKELLQQKDELLEQKDEQITELMYRPDGPGYYEAMDRFEENRMKLQ